MKLNNEAEKPSLLEDWLIVIASVMFIIGATAPVPILPLMFVGRLNTYSMIMLSLTATCLWFGTAWGMIEWSERLASERLSRHYGTLTYTSKKPVIEKIFFGLAIILALAGWFVALRSFWTTQATDTNHYVVWLSVLASLSICAWSLLRAKRVGMKLRIIGFRIKRSFD